MSSAVRRRASWGFTGLCWAVSLAVFSLPILNPDLFWHLSAARRILETHAIPRVDWLSWTMTGAPWVDFEWLTQLIWHSVLRAAGMWGLVGFKAFLFLASALCLWKTLALYKIESAWRAFAVLVWSIALMPSNDLRPDNFSLLFFSLEWLILESYRLKQTRIHFLRFTALFVLWSNVHPGFIYGLGLLLVYALGEWMSHRTRRLTRLAAVCAVGTLLNPVGIGLYGVIWQHVAYLKDLQKYILEWQEVSIFSPWFAAFWILLLASFFSFFIYFLRNRDVPGEHLIILGLSAIAAANHNRNVLYFTVVAVPICAVYLSQIWPKRPAQLGMCVAGAATTGLIIFFFYAIAPALAHGPVLSRFIPEKPALYLASERSVLGGKRMLNPWEWGGYLGYRFFPDYKVFVDGRYIFHSLLGPLQDAKQSPEAYGKFLDQYSVDLVLDRRSRQLLPMRVNLPNGRTASIPRPYYLSFLPRKNWALVYWDDQGLVFVRRSALSADWLDKSEFKIFRPDDAPAAELLVRNGLVPGKQLLGEVNRFLALNPDWPEEKEIRLWVDRVLMLKRFG